MIKRLTIIGSGTMGLQIAQQAALAGVRVIVHNPRTESLSRASDRYLSQLERLHESDRVTFAQVSECNTRTRFQPDMELAVGGADLVIEATPERLAIKQEVLAQAAGYTESVLATVTSSIPLSTIAKGQGYAKRLVGLHLFNPVHAMQLAEIVRGPATVSDAMSCASNFARQLGKQPVIVDDGPGFVVNRVLMALINEAAQVLEDYETDAETIDRCMVLGCNHPMGPLALADRIGLDVVESILQCLHQELGEKYRPARSLRRLVAAGRIGRKSEEGGFYNYRQAKPAATSPTDYRYSAKLFCNED